MNCTTGLEVFSKFPMKLMPTLACGLLDVSKQPADSQLIPYQKTVCEVALQHARGTFSQFKASFCEAASPAVQATAVVIDSGLRAILSQASHVAAVMSIGLFTGAYFSAAAGHKTTSKVLATCGVFVTINTIAARIHLNSL